MRPEPIRRLVLPRAISAALALMLCLGTLGCRHAAPPKPAMTLPAPKKIVLDYRYGWYHRADGRQTLGQIAACYQRNAKMVSQLNRFDPESSPAAGQMIYIPPNNDPNYVRQALVRINEHPELVPKEPWHPPLLANPSAELKHGIETKQADDGLKTVIEGGDRTAIVADPGDSAGGLSGLFNPRRRAKGDSKFDWPVQGKIVTPFNAGWMKACHGIEVAAPAGSPVLAARAGKVLLAQEFPGYGRLILIDHGDGFASVYAYLDAIQAHEGERVDQGRKIASVGRKGSRPMFFFQIRRKGQKVDPMDYLK